MAIEVQCSLRALSKAWGKGQQFKEVIGRGACARARFSQGEDCGQIEVKECKSKVRR